MVRAREPQPGNATLARVRTGLDDAAQFIVPAQNDGAPFFRGLLFAIPPSLLLWGVLIAAALKVLR